MKRVTQETFARKCRNGEWECVWEPNSFGMATVRSTATNRTFQVRVGA